MGKDSYQQEEKVVRNNWRLFVGLIQLFTLLLMICLGYLISGDSLEGMFKKKTAVNHSKIQRPATSGAESGSRVVEGIHLATGLVYADHFEIVRATCTACHSGKLVTQNRASRAGWQQMIHWMQETQGLWDLGKNEPLILDYLEKHYAPRNIGRRAALEINDWYLLE